MKPRIPLSVPTVGPAERALVLGALDSGWIAPVGPQLDAFEAALAGLADRRHAVAVSSGTAALHLSLLVSGVRPGDHVACPTLTFIATAAAIVHAGAVPVFVDCDRTGNMSPELLERAFIRGEETGHPIRAVIPVDLYGKVADHARLSRIASAHDAVYLVDAAESLGAERDGRPAGSQGRLAAFSFNGNKMVTASSGGVVLTDDKALADHARRLATQAREPVAHYEHREVGFNYRLSNLLAALGLAQLERLDEFMVGRRAHRERYRELADAVEGIAILGGGDEGDSCWLTNLVIDPEVTHLTPTSLCQSLAFHGIEARAVFAPMHGQPVFADPERFPRVLDGTADRMYLTGVSVPSSPATTAGEIDEVCERIAAAVSAARGAVVEQAVSQTPAEVVL